MEGTRGELSRLNEMHLIIFIKRLKSWNNFCCVLTSNWCRRLRRKAQTTVEEVHRERKRRKTGLFSLWTNYLHLTARHNHQVRRVKDGRNIGGQHKTYWSISFVNNHRLIGFLFLLLVEKRDSIHSMWCVKALMEIVLS